MDGIPLWLTILQFTVNVLDAILYPLYWLYFQPAKEMKRRLEPKRVKVKRVSEKEGKISIDNICQGYSLEHPGVFAVKSAPFRITGYKEC